MSVKQFCQAFEYYGDGTKYKHRFWRETNLTRILKSKTFVVECEQSLISFIKETYYNGKLQAILGIKENSVMNLPLPVCLILSSIPCFPPLLMNYSDANPKLHHL